MVRNSSNCAALMAGEPREGRFAQVDPFLAEILGREPRTATDLLTDRIAR